jgi:predicted metalloendopeptidase
VAIAAAARIIALETAIAEGHWSRVQNRDRNATYNLLSLTEIEALLEQQRDIRDEERRPTMACRLARCKTFLADPRMQHRLEP